MSPIRVASVAATTAALIFLAACGSTGAEVIGDGKPLAVRSTYTPAPVTTPTKIYTTPVPEDFTLTVNELSRKCFGSAGCNVTFSIKLTNVGAHEFDPSKSFKVVYTINGTEDPYTNNLTITGDRYSYDEEEFTQVKNKSTQLTATITSIIPA